MFKKIFVPTDGSRCSQQALEIGAQLASDQHAQLVLCSVVEPAKPEYAMAFATPELVGGLYDALRDEAEQILTDAAASVASTCQAQTIVREGLPVEEIADAAKASGADLIVMGSHGRRGLPHLFLGSVAEGVLRTAAVPVLIVRETAPQQLRRSVVQQVARL